MSQISGDNNLGAAAPRPIEAPARSRLRPVAMQSEPASHASPIEPSPDAENSPKKLSNVPVRFAALSLDSSAPKAVTSLTSP